MPYYRTKPEPAMQTPLDEALSPIVKPPAGLTSRVVRGSLWNLSGQAVALAATLIATPITIHFLGTEAYGVLALLNILIGYLSFADLGMGTASTRFGADA